MKVLLLHPPQIQNVPQGVSSFSLGLAYAASSIRQAGFQVSLLDCYSENMELSHIREDGLYRIGLSPEEIKERVGRFSPDVVGINIGFTTQFSSAVDLASLVKSVHTRIKVVAGGAHVSAAPGSLNKSDFDYLIVGEGELAFPGLLNFIAQDSGRYPNIAGVYFRDDNQVFTQSSPPHPISDLDSLPFPAYDLLPLNKIWAGRVPYANIIATRGCPYHCVFCSIHSIMGNRLRKRSVENIAGEVELLVHKYGVREIFFEDDNLTTDIEWAKELFQRIANGKMDIEIGVRNGIRADRVDRELLELMRKAGCARVCFAPESGNQEILNRIIRKQLKLEKVRDAVIQARASGLNVTCFFVIGFPGETLSDIKQTVDFAGQLKGLGCDTVDINCATPYPGTDLFIQCLQEGIIDDELNYSNLHTHMSSISTKDFSSDEIMKIRHEAMMSLSEGTREKVARGLRNFARQPRIFITRKIRRYYYTHVRSQRS